MKVAVGLSGGVDSSVTARLLQSAGHDVVGVTMTLGRADEPTALADAQAAARRLDIPLVVVDLSQAWRQNVLDYVRETYLAGATPNPCVRCNATVKFGLLPRYAFETLGCDRFATGHYARLSLVDGRPILQQGVDMSKDQSYFLYRVAPDVLARTWFPLGERTKTEVRALAREAGFAAANRPDSQDFCGGDPMAIVGAADRPGDIVTTEGKVLGRHRGYWHYTIGKRKGLGIGGGTPYYVVGLDAAQNRVIVAFREQTTVTDFRVSQMVWLAEAPVDTGEELMVKVRSAGAPKGPVTLTSSSEGVCVHVALGLSGVAPGQSAVFYRGSQVVGGGLIVV